MLLLLRVTARLFVVCVLGFAGDAGAGESGLLSESEFFQEMPVVLSASRLNQPLSESPTATTVIDRDMIAASGFREIADLFRLVPGFYVTYNNGHQPIVTYHGLADEYARRMQVLIDGRSVYMPPYGGVEWSDLPIAIEDIERIEVIRGPSAATHGANSFLGVINIITRHASQDKGTYLSATQGEYGIGDALVRYGGNSGLLDYRLTVGYRADDGMSDFYQGAQSRYDPQRVNLLNLRADTRLNNLDTLQIQLGYNHGSHGVGNKHPQIYDYFRDVSIDSNYEQLRWQRSLSMGEEITVQFFHNYRRAADSVLTDPYFTFVFPIIRRQQLVDAGDIAQRYDLEMQHTFSPAHGWRVAWGGSIRLDQSTSPVYFRQPIQMHQQRMFAHGEWSGSEKMVVNAGAMVEHNDMTGTDVSPRFSINYHVTPRHTLRASVSRAYRTPVFLEAMNNRHFDLPSIWGPSVDTFVPADALRPEKILSREIGYVGEIPQAGLLLDVKLFRDQIGDIIGDQRAVAPPPQYFCPLGCTTFANLHAATETGIETQVKYQPSHGTQITANYAHIIINGEAVGANAANLRISQSAPVNSISVLAAHRFKSGFSASMGYYQQGEVRALGSGERADLYRRVDLRLMQEFNAGKSKGKLALVVQNLFHEDYSELRQEFRFPIRNYVQLQLAF